MNEIVDAPFPEGMCEEWASVLKGLSPPMESRVAIPEIFNSNLLFPLQRKVEMEMMLTLGNTIEPKTIYEIGSDKGGGLFHWCCLPSVTNVIACEIRGTPYKNLFEVFFPHIDFLWIEDSSYNVQVVEEVSRWLGAGEIDVLFIDGDKYNFALDFDSYLPYMRSDGIVFMHDIQDEAPRFAYDSVCARGYNHREMINTVEAMEAVDREIGGISVPCPHEAWLRHWHGRSCGVGTVFLGEK